MSSKIREELIKYFASLDRASLQPVLPDGRDDDDDEDEDDDGNDCIRLRFYFSQGDEMIECDYIETTPEDWKARPDSKSTRWSVVSGEDVIHAMRFTKNAGSLLAAPGDLNPKNRDIPADAWLDRHRSMKTLHNPDGPNIRLATITMTTAKWERSEEKQTGTWLVIPTRDKKHVTAIRAHSPAWGVNF